MKITFKTILSVLLATVWISASEFFRNEFLVKTQWTRHYEGLGINFPAEAVNGAVWGLWSLMLALAIYILSTRFSLWQSALIAWFMAFMMMWGVIGNLGVLPYGILPYALPLSLLEVFVAAWIIRKFR